jgi:hypothetical protein
MVRGCGVLSLLARNGADTNFETEVPSRSTNPEENPMASSTCNLWIYRSNLDLDEVSEKLNMSPTKVVDRDDPFPDKQWILSSPDELENSSDEIRLWWILAKLSGKEKILQELQEKGIQVRITCLSFTSEDNSTTIFSSETLQRLGSLGVPFQMDIHWLLAYQQKL